MGVFIGTTITTQIDSLCGRRTRPSHSANCGCRCAGADVAVADRAVGAVARCPAMGCVAASVSTLTHTRARTFARGPTSWSALWLADED